MAPFEPGARVRLSGLRAAPELNGSTGVCDEWNPQSGRWTITLGSGDKKSLKPDNLELLAAAETQEAKNLGRGKGKGETTEEADEEVEEMRMASDLDSGFVCCGSLAAAQQALDDGESRLEFGGISCVKERAKCIDLVCELLAGSERCLRGLSFAACGLDAAELRRLAAALQGGVGPLVAAFGLSKYPGVESDAWHSLFAALPAKAVWLDFGDNELSDADMAPLIAGLAGREELDKLYIDGNRLSDIALLCKALPDTGITNLDLGDNQIGDLSVELLSTILPKTVVMILVLGTNPISKMGVTALFDGLPRSSLDVLYLDNTEADDECLAALGAVLAESKLTELHLDATKITDKGVQELLPHIGRGELNYLDVSGNDISEGTVKLLEGAVSVQRGSIQEGEEEKEEEEVEQPGAKE